MAYYENDRIVYPRGNRRARRKLVAAICRYQGAVFADQPAAVLLILGQAVVDAAEVLMSDTEGYRAGTRKPVAEDDTEGEYEEPPTGAGGSEWGLTG